jgi:prepilin-type N-terminal cleavage/methylation domain-containing protein
MHKDHIPKKGFTIIELIVSIVIIGILVTIMIVSYTGIQQRSRDSKRSSDITQLSVAIEKYHSEKSQYPSACPGGDGVECAASSLIAVLAPYLTTIPHDPKNTVDSATDYRYIRGIVTTDSYGLLVNYEAKPVCKTGQNITTSWWSVSYPAC